MSKTIPLKVIWGFSFLTQQTRWCWCLSCTCRSGAVHDTHLEPCTDFHTTIPSHRDASECSEIGSMKGKVWEVACLRKCKAIKPVIYFAVAMLLPRVHTGGLNTENGGVPRPWCIQEHARQWWLFRWQIVINSKVIWRMRKQMMLHWAWWSTMWPFKICNGSLHVWST
jgi:hypothetical protein